MALARVQYPQTVSGNRNFLVPFPYISRDHILVSVEGERVTYSWLNSTTIQLTVAPTVGAIIDISRETERNALLVDFQDASTITEAQLDLAAKQTFFIAQEAFDATGGTLAVANDGSYSASGRRISVLGYPENDTDAATVSYVKAIFAQGADAYEQRALAEAARLIAEAASHRALISEGNAKTAAENAQAASTNADIAKATVTALATQVSADKDTAAQAKTSAGQSATAAEASRVQASNEAAAATTARTAAQTAATEATAARNAASTSAATAQTIEGRIKETTTMDFLNFEIVGPDLIAHFMGYSTETNFTINAKGELEVIL